MNSYTRTTILIRPALLEQVRIFSKQQRKPVTQLIEEGLRKLLKESESFRIQRTYDALKQLDGIGDPQITDASTSIDETLYGENGAWKGENDL